MEMRPFKCTAAGYDSGGPFHALFKLIAELSDCSQSVKCLETFSSSLADYKQLKSRRLILSHSGFVKGLFSARVCEGVETNVTKLCDGFGRWCTLAQKAIFPVTNSETERWSGTQRLFVVSDQTLLVYFESNLSYQKAKQTKAWIHSTASKCVCVICKYNLLG